jgi:Mg2+/Co2+ transporter CorB
MTYEIALILFAIFVLLALSAFFNGSETALTASSRARMHALEQDGDKRATAINRLLKSPERMIGAILIGNTVVDVLAASLATGLGIALYGSAGVLYATTVVSLLIIVFSSVLPKTYALAASDRAALFVAPVMRAIVWLLTPVTIAIEFVVRWLLRLTPSTKDDAANILAAREEIRGTIELQQMEGAVGAGDAAMLGGVLDLRELKIADIMIHRTKMETLNIDAPAAEIIEAVVKGQFTRVPLWKDGPENIVGVLHTKDLLAALSEAGADPATVNVRGLAQPPWFVPDSTSLRRQLNAFLKRKSQLALVVDEYGEVQGLITLEDILEEIVGQISDEHDTQDVGIRRQIDGSVNVDGSITVRDLNRQMNWTLPDEEAATIAGLVIHEAQTIPEPGQAFTFHGYRFEILRRNRNRITALRVKPIAAPAATVGDSVPPAATNAAKPSDTDAMDGG